jgi:Right handed beta helix region
MTFWMIFVGAAWSASVQVQPGDDLATLTGALAAGDTITFADGNYTLESPLTWSGVGTADAPIILQAAEGASPVLSLTSGWAVVVVQDSSFMRISGLRFQVAGSNTEESSVALYVSDVNDFEVSDCELGPVGSTIAIFTGNNTGVSFTGNELQNSTNGGGVNIGCGDASCWTEKSDFSGNYIHDLIHENAIGIELEHGSQGITVTDNVVTGIGGYGIVVGSAEHGDPNTIEGNAIWETTNDSLVLMGSAIVRNNIIFAGGDEGIRAYDPDRGTFESLIVSHNTVVDTVSWALMVDDWGEATGMVLANNALCNPVGYGMTTDEGGPGATNTVSSNVVCGLVTGFLPDAGQYWSGLAYSDFTDADAWDFYPEHDGALLDAGNASGDAWIPDVDFNGAPREGNAPDIGADPLVGAENPGWAIADDFKTTGYSGGGPTDVGGCCSDEAESGAAALLLVPMLGFGAGLRRRRRD